MSDAPLPTVEQFFAHYHPWAKLNYLDPAGNRLSCGLIAGSLELLTGGHCYHVRGKHRASMNWQTTKPLRPLLDAGVTEWGAHVVCIKDKLVYDVLLPGPCPLDEYFDKVFENGNEIEQNLPPCDAKLANDIYIRRMEMSPVVDGPEM